MHWCMPFLRLFGKVGHLPRLGSYSRNDYHFMLFSGPSTSIECILPLTNFLLLIHGMIIQEGRAVFCLPGALRSFNLFPTNYEPDGFTEVISGRTLLCISSLFRSMKWSEEQELMFHTVILAHINLISNNICNWFLEFKYPLPVFWSGLHKILICESDFGTSLDRYW